MEIYIGYSTGILNNGTQNLISVYPNPTNGSITINVNEYNGEFKTELFDVTGRMLKQGNQKQMSLHEYPDGIYFLKLIFENQTKDIRIIKN